MQAASISNLLPGNGPSPKAAALASSGTQPTSPFAALFQSKLKDANSNGKLPAAGKPQDSGREPATTTPVAAQQAPLTAPFQWWEATAFPQMIPNQAFPVPTSLTAQDCDQSQDLTAAALKNNSNMDATAISPAGTTQESAPSQDLTSVPVFPQSVIPASSGWANFPPMVAASQAASNVPILGPKIVPGSSGLAPNQKASSNSSSVAAATPAFGTAQDAAPSHDLTSVPVFPQGVIPASSGWANFPPMIVASQAASNVPIPGPKVVPGSSGLAPNQKASANSSSIDTSQPQNNPSGPQPVPNSAPVNVAVLPNVQTLRAVRADLNFLNLPAMDAAHPASNITASILQTLADNNTGQSGSKLPPGMSATPSGTLVQTAEKTAAIGAPASGVHEILHSQAANATQPAPDVTAIFKLQTKDTSSGSQGNDANTKSDRGSNAAGAHTDEKGFVKSLDAAAVNSGNGPAPSSDSTAAAVATRVPVESQPVSADPKPSGNNSAALQQPQSMPAAAENGPVVNAARLVDRSGQTEIRIEMQAGSLGSVELRAHISGDQIGASIAVEHHDAQMLLTNELPALHGALVEKNLRVDTLSVSQGMPASMGGGPGDDASQRGFGQAPPKPVHAEQGEPSLPFSEAQTEWAGSGNLNAGLSVLA